jgi:glycosyltransferase involved in cell wall biosynthesis
MSLEYPNEIRIADKALRSASRVPASEYHPMEKLLSFHKEAVSNQRTRALESAARVSVVHDWNRNQIPRVLYVSNGAGFSGAEESLCQLLRQLSPARFERFALVSLEGSFTRRLRKAGVTVICPNNDFAELSLDNVHFLLSVCREIRPDIIHLNGLDGFPILAASSLLEIPLIMHVRNGVTEPYREYVHQAAKVITVSNFLKQKMLTLGVPHENVQVVYDEIDVSSAVRLPPRNQSRRLFGLAENAAVVAMVARFVPYKRHDLMIQAAAFLRERIPNLHLLFVGEASEKSAYVQSVLALITRLRLEDAVTWVPFTEDIRQVYAAADVLTLCSDGEGLGRCVVEAMLMGVPVVVTDSGGSKEVISHGRTGLVVGSNDHIGLAEAVAQLLADDFLRRKCAAEASDFVRRHLSSQASARAIEQMYEKILSARDAP